MRTLVETQVLVGERGVFRLVKPLTTIQVPATVQAVIASRIDRLGPEEKRLLQAAAVIGKDVPFTLLAVTMEMPEETLRARLTRLQQAEFLFETGLFPDLEYSFTHALTHGVAYGSLLQERRRTLHARILTHRRGSSTRSGAPSSPRCWPITPSAARCGRRRWPISARRAPRPPRAPPIARRWRCSSRR